MTVSRLLQRAAVGIAIALAGSAAVVFFLTGARESSAQLAMGRKIYDARCAACHGADLQGQPEWQTPLASGRMPAPPHDSSGHTWHHSDRELFTITKQGIQAVVPGYSSDMPAFEGVLTDDEIRAVLAYIKSHWAKQERGYQAERSRVEEGRS